MDFHLLISVCNKPPVQMRDKLVARSSPSNLLFLGELGKSGLAARMEELACFLPGSLALGHHMGLPAWHQHLAEELAYTCYQTAARSGQGGVIILSYRTFARVAECKGARTRDP